MRASLVALLLVAAAAAAAHALTVDKGNSVNLNTWQEDEPLANGIWTVAADGSYVSQTKNGEPTFFYGSTTVLGKTLGGRIKVTADDDDFIGFAIGYEAGDYTSSSADFIVVDWKKGDQGAAPKGAFTTRVLGSTTTSSAWDKTGNWHPLAFGTGISKNGWAKNVEYAFEIEYSEFEIVVRIADGDEMYLCIEQEFPTLTCPPEAVTLLCPDGLTKISDSPTCSGALDLRPFPSGFLAFYNLSQAGVTYKTLVFELLSGLINELVELRRRFYDPDDCGDCYSATIQWGDGAVTEVPSLASSSLSGVTGEVLESHRYLLVGNFTATVTVTRTDPTTGALTTDVDTTQVSISSCNAGRDTAESRSDLSFETFDLNEYVYTGLGEHVFCESSTDGVRVHSCHQPGGQPGTALAEAVAVECGGTAVAVWVAGGGEHAVSVAGEGTTIVDGSSRLLTGGCTVSRAGQTYFVVSPTGAGATVAVSGSKITAKYRLGCGTSDSEGLCGVGGTDGSATNDLLLRDGSASASAAEFGADWHVGAAPSLFPGGSLYTCNEAHEEPVTAIETCDDIPDADQRAAAQECCDDHGVTDAELLCSCTLEIWSASEGCSASVLSQARYNPSCDNDCFERGSCEAGVCICQAGWTGDACETPIEGVCSPTEPSIACPGDVAAVAGTPGCGEAFVTFAEPVGTSNCDGAVTTGPASGTAFPVGATEVTYTVTDASGGTDTCSFTVTVTDSTLECPGATRETADGECSCVCPVGRVYNADEDRCECDSPPSCSVEEVLSENTCKCERVGGPFGASFGDPHFTTFDGATFDYRGNYGEHIFCRSASDELETRTCQGPGAREGLAANDAVAVRCGGAGDAGDALALWLHDGTTSGAHSLSLNGAAWSPLASGDARALPAGCIVSRVGNVYFVTSTAGGARVRIDVLSRQLNVDQNHGSGTTDTVGLCGAGGTDGDSGNDLQLRDGSPAADGEALGAEWQLDADADGATLFPGGALYTCDESVAGPAAPLTSCAAIPEPGRTDAEACCTARGVTSPEVLCACTIDVWAADNGCDAEALAQEAYNTPCTDECSGHGTCDGGACTCEPGWSGASCGTSDAICAPSPPVITCPDNIVLDADLDTCAGNTATWTAPVGSSDCPGASTSGTLSPGASFPDGTTTVTYTVTDATDNEASCSFDVTVRPAPIWCGISNGVSCSGDLGVVMDGTASDTTGETLTVGFASDANRFASPVKFRWLGGDDAVCNTEVGVGPIGQTVEDGTKWTHARTGGGCVDTHAFHLNAGTALSQCGFEGPTRVGAYDYFEATVEATSEEVTGSVFGTPVTRVTVSTMTVRIQFPTSVTVQASGLAWPAVIDYARLSQQTFDVSARRASFVLATSVQWPYYLVPTGTTSSPQAMESIAAAANGGECDGAGEDHGTACTQTFDLSAVVAESDCTVDTEFETTFDVACRAASGVSCDLPDPGTADASFRVRTSSFCAQVAEVASVEPSLRVYSTEALRDAGGAESLDFVTGTRAFLRLDIEVEAGLSVSNLELTNVEIRSDCIGCGTASRFPLADVPAAVTAYNWDYAAAGVPGTRHDFAFDVDYDSVSFDGGLQSGQSNVLVIVEARVTYTNAAGQQSSRSVSVMAAADEKELGVATSTSVGVLATGGASGPGGDDGSSGDGSSSSASSGASAAVLGGAAVGAALVAAIGAAIVGRSRRQKQLAEAKMAPAVSSSSSFVLELAPSAPVAAADEGAVSMDSLHNVQEAYAVTDADNVDVSVEPAPGTSGY